MSHHCDICGDPLTPTDREQHHHDQQRGNNDPDNLRDVHRRCHMQQHDNRRAVANRSQERRGPRRPRTGRP